MCSIENFRSDFRIYGSAGTKNDKNKNVYNVGITHELNRGYFFL